MVRIDKAGVEASGGEGGKGNVKSQKMIRVLPWIGVNEKRLE